MLVFLAAALLTVSQYWLQKVYFLLPLAGYKARSPFVQELIGVGKADRLSVIKVYCECPVDCSESP